MREWDGEFVVRNEQTGNTHLLHLLAGRVLTILLQADEALEPSQVVARLEAASPAAEASDAEHAVEEVLGEFRRLGLADSDRT